MKRGCIAVALAVLAGTSAPLFAGSGSSAVTTNAVKILDTPGRRSGQAWEASTAYAQGEVVRAGQTHYMALAAGTSGSEAPNGVVDVVDGTVTWRHVLSRVRKGLFISNEGDERVTVNWVTPTAGDGITLGAGEKVVMTAADTPQVAVYAIADSGSQNVSVLEW